MKETSEELLEFIGIGSAFNTAMGNTAALLREEHALLLIDCGSSVFHRLKGAVFLQDFKQVDIILTHLHPDHAGSVGDLIFYLAHRVGVKPTLHHPSGEELRRLLALQGVREAYYNLDERKTFELSEPFFSETISIRFLPQEHSPQLKAFGFLLRRKEITCFYSGDSKTLQPEALELLKAGRLRRFYQDTCSYKLEGAGHLYLGDLEEEIEAGYRNAVICMHIDEDFDQAAARRKGFRVAEVKPIFSGSCAADPQIPESQQRRE